MATQLATAGALGLAAGFLAQYWMQRWMTQGRCAQTESFSAKNGAKKGAKKGPELESDSSHSDSSCDSSASDSEEESVDIDSTALNEIPGEVRMTLIVRQDLKMGKGKAAAQCSHATLALYKKMANAESAAFNPQMLQRWEWGNGQAKITLQVPTQEEMDMLYAQAMEYGVNCYIVHDAGRTQIQAGSATVLGLGPAPKAVLDRITSHLKLY